MRPTEGGTSPKVWWLNGRPYYDQASYSSALASSNQAKALAAQAARERAAAEAARQAAAASAAAKAKVPATAGALTAAQAQELAKRAAAEAAAARAEREAQIQRQALAARQTAERQAMLSTRQQAAQAVAEQQVRAEGERKAQLARGALARHQAYDALQARLYPPSAETAQGLRLRAAKSAVPTLVSGPAAPAPDRAAMAQGQRLRQAKIGAEVAAQRRADAPKVARQKLVAKAEATGNWKDAIDLLESQSRQTGGRYVDEELWNEVQKKYVVPVEQVGMDYQAALDRLSALLDKGDMPKLLAELRSPSFRALEARFAQLFGDGKKPGEFAAVAKRLADIADARDRVWRATVGGAAPGSSDAQIAAVTRRISEEANPVVGRAGRIVGDVAHGLSAVGGRQQPLTYRTRVIDPVTGKESYKTLTGLEAWDARERDRAIQTAQQQLEARLKARHSGMALADQRDAAFNDLGAQVDAWVPGGRKAYQAIFNMAPGYQREQAVQRYVAQAGEAYDRVHGSPGRPGGMYGPASAAYTENLRKRQDFLNQLYQGLSGAAAGEWGMGQAIGASWAGPLLSGLGTLSAGVTAGLRFLTSTLGGRPGYQLQLGGDYGNLSPDQLFRGKADPKAWDAFLAGLGSSDLGERAAAIRDFGSGLFTGNLGFLASAGLDPLSFVGPGVVADPLKLAVSRAGGASGLLNGMFGQALRDYARYQLPKFAGGVGRNVVVADLAKLALARQAGLPFAEVLDMSDERFRELWRSAIAGEAELKASSAFAQLLERTGVNEQQLLHVVAQQLPDIGKAFGLSAVDPFEMGARLRLVREAADRAEAAAKVVTQEQALRPVRAQAAEALRSVRVEAGRPVPPVVTEAPVVTAERARLVAAYEGTVGEYQAATKAALKAADEIPLAAKAGDARRLRTLQVQLDRHYQRVLEFEGQVATSSRGKVVQAGEGLVAKRYRELSEYASRVGSSPDAPSYLDTSWATVRRDRLMVRGLLDAARKQAAGLTGPAREAALAEVKRLRRALSGLEFEATYLDRGRTVGIRTARANLGRVRAAVRAQRIAAPSVAGARRGVEVARDISSRLGAVTTVTGSPFADQAARDAFDSLTRRVAKLPVAMSPAAKEFFTLAGRPLTLLESVEALSFARRPGGFLGMWRQVASQLRAELRKAGYTGSVQDFVGALRASHVGVSVPGSLREYRALDQAVAAKIREVRGYAAEGQVRLRPARGVARTEANALRPDSDVAVVVAKMDALATAPGRRMGIFEYDELRGVLGDITVRRNVQARLLRDARREAAASGEDFEAVYLRLRQARADAEAVRNFGEFAARAENQGLAPARLLSLFEAKFVSADLGRAPGLVISDYQRGALERAWQEISGTPFADREARHAFLAGEGAAAIPLGNRAEMRSWLVEHGYWSPRTGEQIAAGQRVWSVEEERAFWESHFAYQPAWTDPEVLRVVLSDQRLHQAAFREWGFFDDNFEALAGAEGLHGKAVVDGVVWGAEGVRAQRSIAELRDWAVQRYGDLVSPDGGQTLTAMPWLMRAEAAADGEYLTWLRGALSEAGKTDRGAALEAARERLPKRLADALFDGDAPSRMGLEVDRSLLREQDVQRLADAITKASSRRIERLLKDGDLLPGDWLPQEQLRFAYDVTSELLLDRRWQSLLGGRRLVGTALNLWGQLWRTLVSFQPAFPIMNLIDSFGFKRLYLAVFENSFRPLSRDVDGLRLLPGAADDVLTAIGAESHSIFGLNAGSPFARFGDKALPLNVRGGALVSTVLEFPVRASKFGEDLLRADFARSVAGRTYRALRASGMGEEAAIEGAKFEAKRLVAAFFAVQGSSPLIRVLNELVPFFSYNFNQSRFALRALATHPVVWLWGDQLRQTIEEANRRTWEETYPGVPFPEGASASWLWIKVGEDFYQIDLGSFSDWTRALRTVTTSSTVSDWFQDFVRLPHPSQAGAWAALTGGVTPWGKPGSIRELSFWADLVYWLQGKDYAKTADQRTLLQMGSQLLFFKKFGRITPLKAEIQTYFMLRDLGPEPADAFLQSHPDLQIYFAQQGPSGRSSLAELTPASLLSDEQRTRVFADLDAWKALNERLDADVFKYATEPWSDAYKAAKRARDEAKALFLRDHPDLVDFWALYKSSAELAADADAWRLDAMVEGFFDWKAPKRADFKDELAYQRGLVAFHAQREAYLLAHPALAKVIAGNRDGIEGAWHAQEERWGELLDLQARLKVRILEEQLKGAAADRDLIDGLYDARRATGLALDAEAFADVYAALVPGRGKAGAVGGLVGALDRLGLVNGQLPRLTQIPGLGDFIYGRSTPEQRAKIDANDRYARQMGLLVSKVKDGRQFFDLLRQNPWLWQEYMSRHPEVAAKYQAGREYFRWISGWVSHLKRQDFAGAQAAWDRMPAWVKERYFAKHPESKMRDGGLGSAKFSAGQAYYSSMGSWVKLLKEKRYQEADAFFRHLPSWQRERFFAKHPGDRARLELESSALRAGANYFLTSDPAERLRILRENPDLRRFLELHGGNEAARFGLITAIYRAIPVGEAWLRRTFAARYPEVFSKQAAGERKLASVAKSLAAHPEMRPFYEAAFALQSHHYTEQLKRSGVAPKPLEAVHLRRAVKRVRRRHAAFGSLWTLHQAARA